MKLTHSLLSAALISLVTTPAFANASYKHELAVGNFTSLTFQVFQEADRKHAGYPGASHGLDRQSTIQPGTIETGLTNQVQSQSSGFTSHHSHAYTCLDAIAQTANGNYVMGNFYIDDTVFLPSGMPGQGSDARFDSVQIYSSNGAPSPASPQANCFKDTRDLPGVQSFVKYGPEALLNPLDKPYTNGNSSTNISPASMPATNFASGDNGKNTAASNYEAMGFAGPNANTKNPVTSVVQVYYEVVDGHQTSDPTVQTKLYLLCVNPNGKAGSGQMCPAAKLPKVN